ncbi:MAG: hypothetical protein SOY94_01405 [Candidatus Limiplasma sp.]|nr:hypothetical protein [Candidatus Limiplasma sp.]
MRDYRIRFGPYEIDKNEYDELKAFCRQYPKKKARAAALADVSSPALSGMPHGTGVSDPVGRAVEKRERLLRDCEMIERIAAEVDGGRFAKALILNCCCGVGYAYMDSTILPTNRKNDYFLARRKFFWKLKNERIGEN